jgi:DNA (cytosine-5)-methyltransferase 1
MRELSLFTGAGGGLLASHLLGWTPIAYVEIDDYCQRVLAQRIADGQLPCQPIFTDINSFASQVAPSLRGLVDVVTGGFPCQDVSSAGRGGGLGGKKSSLWYAMLDCIAAIRPRFVFAENSPYLRSRGLQEVLEGLASVGYHAAWGVLGARHVGAPHRRDRLWIRAELADPDNEAERVVPEHAEVGSTPGPGESNAPSPRRQWVPSDPGGLQLRVSEGWRPWTHWEAETFSRQPLYEGWNEPAPFARMDDGVAHRVDRTRATGNGQVPAVAALAWIVLGEILNTTEGD